MILEGIVTTLAVDGMLNVAPMGPKFEGDWSRFVLRPFKSSTTYRNLRDRGEGVLHITDDVLLLARAAIGPVPDVETLPAQVIQGRILKSAARYMEFRVVERDDSEDRSRIVAETVATGTLNELFGLNRAKNAIVEAAILATRVHMLERDYLADEFNRLRPLIEKTGGAAEREAFQLLCDYVNASEVAK